MKDVKILAIETSCDETSMAIVENGRDVIAQVTDTQIDTFKNLGGVVPEMASRMHAKNIFLVYTELFSSVELTMEDIDAIAVTQGPGLIGSLLVGINFAKTLALEYNKKLIAINHMEGHIYACNLSDTLKFPHLSLIVSGGHTEFVYLPENNKFQKVGMTLDDAIGEAYDKVARLLKLPYPGGPVIDRLAAEGEDVYQLPEPMNDGSLNFSFSGIKSAAYNKVNTMRMKEVEIIPKDFARSFQDKVMSVVKKKLNLAIEMYEPKQVSIVGGVSANSELRKLAGEDIIIPELKYTTDNAAMIGAIAYEKYLDNSFVDPFELDVNVNLEII